MVVWAHCVVLLCSEGWHDRSINFLLEIGQSMTKAQFEATLEKNITHIILGHLGSLILLQQLNSCNWSNGDQSSIREWTDTGTLRKNCAFKIDLVLDILMYMVV